MKKILFVFTLSLILAATGYVFSAGYYGTTSGGSTEGLTLGTNSTLTVADSVAANITAPFGSGAFADTYTGTGAENITTTNLTATTANITTLTAATANITSGNITGITNLGATTANATTVNVSGVLGANVINASGTLTAVPSATAPIMFGNTTPVNTSTGATFPTAVKTQISKASAFTDAAVGDLIIVTGGTGATTGQYRLTTKTSNDLVVVDRNIHASGSDITDGAFSVYKDVVILRPTDGTNGMMLNSYSHQNKPLQLGGTTYTSSSASALSYDVTMGERTLWFSSTGGALWGTTNSLYVEGATNGIQFLSANATSTWNINSSGHLLATDNTFDIGATGAKRPRTGYFGTSVITPKSTIKGTAGGLSRLKYEVLSGAMTSGSVTITMGIPTNARLLGIQLKVRDLITSGDGGTTWSAAFAGGATDTIGSGYAFAVNTVANVLIPSNVTTAGTNIVITPDSGTFSAGNVQAIVYTEELDAI
jgi:hypothetical protein